MSLTYQIKTDSKTGKKTVRLRAGDVYHLGTENPEKAASVQDLDVTEKKGTLTVWKGETGKKPRSERQEIALG